MDKAGKSIQAPKLIVPNRLRCSSLKKPAASAGVEDAGGPAGNVEEENLELS